MKRSLLSRVGAVTHVTCIERHEQALATAEPYGQLSRHGLGTLESVCRMLEARPVRVMARCSASGSEVFLHLSNGAQVAYYGAMGAASNEQSLWVEGPGGSLLREGALVWWRKRGWPKFVPWRLSSGSRSQSGSVEGPLSQAIRHSSDQGTVVSLNG